MQNIEMSLLATVCGGADDGGGGDGGGGGGGVDCTPGNPMGAAPQAPQQSFENNHSGPSGAERYNTAFDNSTRAMRTFNDTLGWSTKSPGMGAPRR